MRSLASDGVVSGGGAVAALAASASAAGLVMVARASHGHGAAAPGAAAQAHALVDRVAPLLERNTVAYHAALAALREPSEGEDAEARDARLGAALHAAAEGPLIIAEIATDVAELAAEMAAWAEPDRLPDAVTSAVLAHGSARAAAALVRANLTARPGDERVAQASALAELARSAAERALQRLS